MKIYTRVVIDMSTGDVLEEESFEYVGDIARCIGLGGGSDSSRSAPVRVDIWNKEQKELAKSLFSKLQEASQRPTPRYPGMMYVPETGYESKYLQGDMSQFAGNLARYRTLGQEGWDRARQPSFTPTPETTEMYYKDFIKNPMMKEFEEVYEPFLRENFVGPSFHSSARAEAQRKGAYDLASTLGAKRAELYYSDEQDRREALESAAQRDAQLTPQMSQLLSESSYMEQQYIDQQNKDRATLSREIEQERVMADFQRWLMGESVDGVTPTQYDPTMQLIFQALGLQPYVVGNESESSGFNFNASVMSGS